MKKYNLIISDFYKIFPVIKIFIDLRIESFNIFRENISNITLAGSFPYCIWDSECNIKEYANNDKIQEIFNCLIDNKISFIFNFTNTTLDKKHFDDTFSNWMLNLAMEFDFKISAIVQDDKLAKYIKTKYLNSNIIKPNIDNSLIVKEIYDSIIINKSSLKELDISLNREFEYILILNSFCKNPNTDIDYKSKCKLNFENLNSENIKDKETTFLESKSNNFFVSNEEICKILKNEKIFNFIINSNTDNIYELVECYLYFFIKEEYIDNTRLIILKRLFE